MVMQAIEGAHLRVAQRYLRPLAHMRQQVEAGRFCPIFGAGAGHDLGFPKWNELLDRLAIDADGVEFEGYAEAKKSTIGETSHAQHLVKLFEQSQYRANGTSPAGTSNAEDLSWLKSLSDAPMQRMGTAEMLAEWRRRVHQALYRDVNPENEAFTKTTCYYKSFLELIRRTEITITYNFDDSIERFLATDRSPAEKRISRGYTTIYDENSQLPSNSPVIYHPNGFLANRIAEKPSTYLIFSEDSFSEQLNDSILGRHAVMQSQLSQKTCLFIGCSLQDPTLNFLLKRNAQHHPGHFHYYVYWAGAKGEYICPPVEAERLFDLYNLITLNLTSNEICLLGELLSQPYNNLVDVLEEQGLSGMFAYIVSGAVGSGKSSVISHFRSLKQHDDWLEPRLEGMEIQVDKLKNELSKVRAIDDWVDAQFAKKNRSLYDKENSLAVHILDRGPLDPLAFRVNRTVAQRARAIRSAMKRGTTNYRQEIVPAHVILLTGDAKEMEIRARARGKDYDEDAVRRQQADLSDAYGSENVTVLDTQGLTLSQVVTRVARIIHRVQYQPLQLSDRLDEIISVEQTQLFQDD